MTQLLPDSEKVMVDYGPIHMNIQAWNGNSFDVAIANKGGQRAIELLNEVSQYQAVIRQKSRLLRISKGLPPAVAKMIESSKSIPNPDLTPLSAVAGTISDFVADYLLELGASKVIVDNGGDIAIRMPLWDTARIGIRTDIRSANFTHMVTINGSMGVGGVCTSGFGGRSLTLGIASAAVAMSQSASLADVVATLLANATFIESSNIIRLPAETVYPDTDIPGLMAVTEVGRLSDKEIEEALKMGERKAQELLEKQVIKGAFIAVQEKTATVGQLRMD